MKKKKRLILIADIIGVIAAIIIFIVPFYFMFVNSLKSQQEAGLLNISWPSELHFENYAKVFSYSNYQLLTAFKNNVNGYCDIKVNKIIRNMYFSLL